MSRFGARIPLYGPLDRVIPSKEASAWLKALLSMDLPAKEAVAHALIQLARFTGDRERDVAEGMRKQVDLWLKKTPQHERLQNLLLNPEKALEQQEQAWIFGESLPSGLVLTS